MSQPEHVVVVGAGLGGVRTVEQLRNSAYQGAITLVGEEPYAPYDRPPLSKQVLAGSWEADRVTLRTEGELASLDVRTRFGCRASALHDGAVELEDGTVLEAGAVVVATGAEARRLPGQPPEVRSLRTLDDSLALRAALADAKSLLIVGAGFIGAEVAAVARERGIAVTVLEASAVPCERALGRQVGVLCARLLADAGVDLRLGARLTGFADAHTVLLGDGSRASGDVVLVGVGSVPKLPGLRLRDADTADGLACNVQGRVAGARGVWAVGDVAAWEDPAHGGRIRCEHWTNVVDQAAVVACDIAGTAPPPPSVPYFWSDQFGLKIQMIGRPKSSDTVVPLRGDGLAGGEIRGTVAGYFDDDRMVAVVGFGAARHIAKYRSLVMGGARRTDALALV